MQSLKAMTTGKTLRMFEFIKRCIASNSVAPTIAEIGRQFNMSSPASVHKQLQKMKALGWITIVPNVSRGIRIADQRQKAEGRCVMENVQLKHCPICTKHLPVSEFGRNAFYDTRGAKDGRNRYCKSCIRKKRNAQRKVLRDYKEERKKFHAEGIVYRVAAYEAKANPVKVSPVEKVLNAIKSGSRTQAEIGRETKVGKDEIGDAIANLLLWTKEIKTQVIDGTRMYFLNTKEVKTEIKVIPVAVPFFDIARKLGAPSVKGEKRIQRVAVSAELQQSDRGPLKAPFPWFGGKSKVARLVWQRFGNVPNYVEPFAGSLAVLLGRESEPRVETVNDIDCWISNFWRALQFRS